MRRPLNFALFLLACLAAPAKAPADDLIIPAGTLVQCTLDEPRFSSQTAQLGDPVVCHAGWVRAFGRPAFPRGADLTGRFAEFRDPGRFFGKGWIKLEFDRLVLPETVLPLTAKLISVPNLRVDAEGRIHGKGHPRRDALGWAIPLLWPVKVVTLPMRGPRPTLKGEVRVTLRLMDDVSVPVPVPATTPRAGFRAPEPLPSRMRPTGVLFPRIWYGGTSWPALASELSPARAPSAEEQATTAVGREPASLTLLLLNDGSGYLAREYWIEDGYLRVVASDGSPRFLPLGRLDLEMTVRLNRERGVSFVLRSKPAER